MLSEAQKRAIDVVLASSNWEIGHVRHVRQLAVALFQSLRPLHQLDDASAELLEVGALLHDVGYPADPANHHKVSARIIRTLLHAPFAVEEVELIALLARYHRKGGPKARHRRYGRLDDQQRRTVSWLAGILRVADGLDREHVSAVRSLTASVDQDRLLIAVSDRLPDDAPTAEALTAARSERLAASVDGGLQKRDVLERISGLPVVIEVR
jgi:exopolyphosphatase / guanosine-5'-triphosphate,3'-diphosphate pyrophosphatase